MEKKRLLELAGIQPTRQINESDEVYDKSKLVFIPIEDSKVNSGLAMFDDKYGFINAIFFRDGIVTVKGDQEDFYRRAIATVTRNLKNGKDALGEELKRYKHYE